MYPPPSEFLSEIVPGRLIEFQNLTLGWSASSVYRATVAIQDVEHHLIVKTATADLEAPFHNETDENRSYGDRFSNFLPAYDLMRRHGIKLPKLLGQGRYGSLCYVAMERLPGTTTLSDGMLGTQLALLHSITRPYQGWVDMPCSLARNWTDTFFGALHSHLARCAATCPFVLRSIPAIDSFIARKKAAWRTPTEFVLSHTDGFQGMAEHDASGDLFSGVIDIEDHMFTDQRFVLSGLQVLSRLWGTTPLTTLFWDRYGASVSLQPGYAESRPLFELFYLLSWLPAYYARTDRDMRHAISGAQAEIAAIVA